MSSAGTSKQKEVFDENAGSRKLERQLKRLTSVTTGTDIKGLAEKENVFIETDIVIPAGMETDYEKWCEMHQDDELPPLPVDGEDDLPAMGEDELFWFQAYQAELNKHKEAENENRMIREKLEQTQARSAELRVLRDKREEELQRKIDNEKERHRADNEKERQRADNEKEHQRTDNEKERQCYGSLFAMSSRKTFVLRNVPVKTNSENLPQGPKVGRSKSASLFESKKAVDVNKSKQITSFFKPTKSSKLFDVYAEENAENLDVYMVDKEVNAVPTTSEIGCQTDIAGIENHYEDPKLTIEDLTSIRPTITVYRRRITKLQKQTEDMLNDSLELSINLSRELGEMYELEDDIKALEDYEICQEDIEDEEEDE